MGRTFNDLRLLDPIMIRTTASVYPEIVQVESMVGFQSNNYLRVMGFSGVYDITVPVDCRYQENLGSRVYQVWADFRAEDLSDALQHLSESLQLEVSQQLIKEYERLLEVRDRRQSRINEAS